MSAVQTATTTTTPLRQRLGRAGGRLRPGFAGFWSWWTHALASWLPLRVRELFGLARERVQLRVDADSLRLTLERGETSREIGQVPWSPEEAALDDPLAPLLAQRIAELPRWLVLPAAAGLRRPLVLPAAAADRLRDVLAFEIDRQTPFAAADVHYDARVTGRRGDGQIEVELVVVPAKTMEAALARLGPLAQTLTGVDMATADGRGVGVNLLAGTQRHRRVDPWLAWNLALGAVAAIAVAAGLWQILANRESAADGFEREVAQRADTTYLEKLSIEDQRILLIGLSSEASSLVRRMEGSPLWRAPALTGALQPDPRSGRDRFTLTAELAVARPPAAAAAQGRDADARSAP